MDSLTLRPSKKKWLLIVIGSLVFIFGGFLLILQGGFVHQLIGCLGIVFFGLCALGSLCMLVPGVLTLELTRDGFSIKRFGAADSKWPIKWQDISDFSVMELCSSRLPQIPLFYHSQIEFAGIRFTPSARSTFPPPRLTRMDLNRKKYGCDGGLPDTFGLSARDLVDLLNEWKNKYGTPKSEPVSCSNITTV